MVPLVDRRWGMEVVICVCLVVIWKEVWIVTDESDATKEIDIE